ncbi:MAG: PrgI family protein [Candidatus Paceibacterota bacterium]|jgi:hypothetical protein
MQFRVPQFIDIEDKIFGPFTFKQFVYLVGGAGICFVLYKLLPIYIAIFLILPIAAFSAALTFYKVNGKPFLFIVQAYINYLFQNKLYIWKKAPPEAGDKGNEVAKAIEQQALVPKLSNSRLKDIAWSLDILDVKKKQ